MSFFGSLGNDGGFSPWTTDISNEQNRGKLGGVLAVMPVFATIFGAVVSGFLIEKLDFLLSSASWEALLQLWDLSRFLP